MSTWLRALVLVCLLSAVVTGAPLRAQTPPAAPAPTAEPAARDRQAELIDFAVAYTRTVMIGVVAGGLLMNVLVGGPTATLTGALAGSTVASWLFINQVANSYVVFRTGPAHGP